MKRFDVAYAGLALLACVLVFPAVAVLAAPRAGSGVAAVAATDPAVFPWGDPRFTDGNTNYFPRPAWALSGRMNGGLWITNDAWCGWQPGLGGESMELGTNRLLISVNRKAIPGDLGLAVSASVEPNAQLVMEVCDATFRSVCAPVALYPSGVTPWFTNTVPLAGNPAGSVIAVSVTNGLARIFQSVLFGAGDGVEVAESAAATVSEFGQEPTLAMANAPAADTDRAAAKAGLTSSTISVDASKPIWELDPKCYTIDIVTGQRLVDVQAGDGFYLGVSGPEGAKGVTVNLGDGAGGKILRTGNRLLACYQTAGTYRITATVVGGRRLSPIRVRVLAPPKDVAEPKQRAKTVKGLPKDMSVLAMSQVTNVGASVGSVYAGVYSGGTYPIRIVAKGTGVFTMYHYGGNESWSWYCAGAGTQIVDVLKGPADGSPWTLVKSGGGTHVLSANTPGKLLINNIVMISSNSVPPETLVANTNFYLSTNQVAVLGVVPGPGWASNNPVATGFLYEWQTGGTPGATSSTGVTNGFSFASPGAYPITVSCHTPTTNSTSQTTTAVVLKVEFLDKDKNETPSLKVAKWQDGYQGTPPTVKADFIDSDPDKFFVRVNDQSKKGSGKVSVKLSSDSPGSDYDDDATEIELDETAAGSGVFESKSLMLMGDDVDDDHPVESVADDVKNDRSHKIALNGDTKVVYPAAGAAICEKQAHVPLVKTLTLTVYILRDKKQADGGTPVTTVADVEADIKWARERYAQTGTRVEESTIQIVDPPTGVNLADGSLDEFPSAPNLTDEEKALFDALGTDAKDDVIVFYVNALSSGSTGEQTREGAFGTHPAKRQNNVVVSAGGKNRTTITHELMHVLIDSGHDGSTEQYVFHATKLSDSDVNECRRIKPAQATSIQSSKFVH